MARAKLPIRRLQELPDAGLRSLGVMSAAVFTDCQPEWVGNPQTDVDVAKLRAGTRAYRAVMVKKPLPDCTPAVFVWLVPLLKEPPPPPE